MTAAPDTPDGFAPDTDLDPAETHAGPYLRAEGPTGPVIGLRVAAHHCNEHGSLHGGVQMAMADYTVGSTARAGTEDGTLTVSFDAQFVDGAREGDWIEGRAEVVRRTGSLVFLRGQLTCGERPILSFNGVVKRLRPR